MANNKLYENYLMHYRTKGSKNGYTKYPGKYTPIGEKAIDSTGLNFDRYKAGQRFWNPKDGGEGPTMVADKAQVAVARAEHDRNNRRAEARKKIAPVLSGTQAVGMRGIGAYNDKKNYDEARRANQQEAEARRIKGGNPYVNQREENRKAAEARRIAGRSGISTSQRQKEAEARRIDGGSQGTITRAEAARRANQQAAEQRRIAGGSAGTTRPANAKPILSGTQAVGMRGVSANQQATETKRKNINDWYGNQVRGGNQSASEARRIKGGTQGVTTTAQAAAKNAESERKKKKLKGVLKALLKSNSRGISRFF